MKLQKMSTKSLAELHNTLADTPADPKSSATKAKVIARIEAIAGTRDIDLAPFWPAAIDEVTKHDTLPQADDTGATDISPKAKTGLTGKGIGRLAQDLLLDPAGYPHSVIAEMVNTLIEGAQATAKSIRSYACRMRKEGVDVSERERPVA